MPTIPRLWQPELGSTRPNPSPKPPSRAYELRNSGAQAEQKARRKRTPSGDRCHSLTTLLDELATRTRNTIRLAATGASFDQLTKPTPTQARALALIESYTLSP